MITKLYLTLLFMIAQLSTAHAATCVNPPVYQITFKDGSTLYLVASIHGGLDKNLYLALCFTPNITKLFRNASELYFELVPGDETAVRQAYTEFMSMTLAPFDMQKYTSAVRSMLESVVATGKTRYSMDQILRLHPYIVRELLLSGCQSYMSDAPGTDDMLRARATAEGIAMFNFNEDAHLTVVLTERVDVGAWIVDTLAVARYVDHDCQPSLDESAKKVIDDFLGGEMETLYRDSSMHCKIIGSCVVDDQVVLSPARTASLAEGIRKIASIDKVIFLALGASHTTYSSGMFTLLTSAGASIKRRQ